MVGHYAILFERLNMKKTFHILYHLQYGSMWYHRHIDQVVKHNDETKTKTDLFDIGGIFISRTNLYSLSSQLFPSYPFTHVQLNANNWSLQSHYVERDLESTHQYLEKSSKRLLLAIRDIPCMMGVCLWFAWDELGRSVVDVNLVLTWMQFLHLGMVSPGLCKC